MRFLNNMSKDLQHGFHPIYYFSRCVGLWPFTITYNSNGTIKAARIRLFDMLWFLFSIGFYLTALYCNCAYLKTNMQSDNTFHLINFTTQMAFILFGIVGVVLDMFNRKRLVNILDSFAIFDRKVSSNIWSPSNNLNYFNTNFKGVLK